MLILVRLKYNKGRKDYFKKILYENHWRMRLCLKIVKEVKVRGLHW